MAWEILRKFSDFKDTSDCREQVDGEFPQGDTKTKNYLNKIKADHEEEIILRVDKGSRRGTRCKEGAVKREQLQQWKRKQEKDTRDSREQIVLEEKEITSHQVNPRSSHLSASHQVKAHKVMRDNAPLLTNTPLTWSDGGRSNFAVCGGGAAVKEKMAFFLDWSGKLCQYDSTNKKWSVLPKYPYQYGSLAVVNDRVTAVGGCSDFCKKDTYTSTLLSLQDGRWIEVYPPMPTRRRDMIVMATREHLIVAGGMCGPFINSCLDNVEVMDTKSLIWSRVATLPHPLTGASATVLKDHLFMVGGFTEGGETKSVLTCSLTELLQSQASTSSLSVWRRVADTPAYLSTCAAVSGELLAVGGCNKEGKATTAIHRYNPLTNSWAFVSTMATARYNSAVGVLSTNEMIVVGGDTYWNKSTDKVELAKFNLV